MNREIALGVLAMSLAGCAGPAIQTVAECDDSDASSIREYTYPNVRIGKLFGINAEVLSNTNKFPAVGIDCRRWTINLPKEECGFGTCVIGFERDAKIGSMELETISMERTLNPGAGEEELLQAFRKVIGWLNDNLGTDMKLYALVDLNRFRVRDKSASDYMDLGYFYTSVCANLADGQQIRVSGHDAVYMKRGGECVEMFPPRVKISFCKKPRWRRVRISRNVPDEPGLMEKENVQDVSIGVDISEKVSAAIKNRDCEFPRRAKPPTSAGIP